ncbi:hypothetical protein SAE02_72000 [Skermanella aerolata]|uniref:Uncharacterized protein n=1 Tax=Skermanella aerolata TaxID=393310 RepID=A0A512E2U5_9PROT|nr:hypothetical protein SAE02_72000 [Skermanella aerolata]
MRGSILQVLNDLVSLSHYLDGSERERLLQTIDLLENFDEHDDYFMTLYAKLYFDDTSPKQVSDWVKDTRCPYRNGTTDETETQ